jgi:DNA polymerase-1
MGTQGEMVNAVVGLMQMVERWVRELRPTHGAAVFDRGPSAWRRELLPTYKKSRPSPPEEMLRQLPLIRQYLEARGFPVVESEGEEGDDVIATLAQHRRELGDRVLIASNDKDFAQLVSPRVSWVRSERGRNIVVDSAGVLCTFGVEPSQMVDFLALVGDTVDDIPGAAGVGRKTAADLLVRFGSIEGVFARLEEVPSERLRRALRGSVELLNKNKSLIALRTDLKLEASSLDCLLTEPDGRRLDLLTARVGPSRPRSEVSQIGLWGFDD